MSRYRPPRKPGSKYITPEGHERLQQELKFLWRVKRPHVTRILSEAAAEGDRSENAEYIYRKKQLREIDGRVRFLTKRLENMKVVRDLPSDPNRIYFGAWFTLEDEAGEEQAYRVVGPDEIDPKRRWISMDSPMGRAVLGKGLDEEFTLNLPSGEATFMVLEVRYDGDPTQEFSFTDADRN